MPRKIIITDLSSLDKLPKLIANLKSPTWSYLGTNSRLLYQLKPVLNQVGEFTCLGQEFNDIASKIRKDFLNFDSIIDLKAKDKVQHDTTHFAEKSPISSPLFGNVCTTLTFHQFIEETQDDLVLIVDHWFVAFFIARLENNRSHNAIHLNCVNAEHLERNTFRALRAVRRQQKQRAHQLVKRYETDRNSRNQWVATLRRDSNSPISAFPQTIDTLFALWTTSQTFSSHIDAGKDTYFGDLPKELGQCSETAYLVNPIDLVEPLQTIYTSVLNSNHAPRCLFLEDCAEAVSFYQEAEKTIHHDLRRKGDWILNGVKLNSLMEDAFYQEKAEGSQGRSLQFYFVAKFLSERGVKVKRLLFPYENQPWEKALRLGFERWMPSTRIVGYYHNANSEFWLSSYPGETNLRDDNIPHQVAVPGQYWHDRLLQNGFSRGKLSIWPAFRYSFLHETTPPPRPKRGAAPEAPITTLLALPIDQEGATELLVKSLRVFRSHHRFELIVRFHPKAGFDSALITDLLPQAGMKQLPKNIHCSQGTLNEDLEQSQLVIANGTSIELQAMHQGIATLCLLSEHTLDMQMLPLPKYTYSARTSEELKDVLDAISNSNSHQEISPWSDSTLNHYFSKNTEKTRKRAFF